MLNFLGDALGGLFGYKGTKDTNIANAQQAARQIGSIHGNRNYATYKPENS